MNKEEGHLSGKEIVYRCKWGMLRETERSREQERYRKRYIKFGGYQYLLCLAQSAGFFDSCYKQVNNIKGFCHSLFSCHYTIIPLYYIIPCCNIIHACETAIGHGKL